MGHDLDYDSVHYLEQTKVELMVGHSDFDLIHYWEPTKAELKVDHSDFDLDHYWEQTKVELMVGHSDFDLVSCSGRQLGSCSELQKALTMEHWFLHNQRHRSH